MSAEKISYIQSDVEQLKTKIHFSKGTKARVVPYIFTHSPINNSLKCYFLMCKEKNNWNKKYSKEYTNFLGGHHNNGETIFQTAKRELYEESLNTIDTSLIDSLPPQNIIKRNKRFIFFLPCKPLLYKPIAEFQKKQDEINNSLNKLETIRKILNNPNITEEDVNYYMEIKSLEWYSTDTLLLKGLNIYRSVREVFYNMFDSTSPNDYTTLTGYLHKLYQYYLVSIGHQDQLFKTLCKEYALSNKKNICVFNVI